MTDEITLIEDKWGNLPHFRRVGRNKWHSSCPVCGEQGHIPGTGLPNRFWIEGSKPGYNAHGICTRCGVLQWLDDGEERRTLSQEEIDKANRLRIKHEMERAEYLANKIRWINENKFWLEYHENMTAEQRRLWHNEGIPDWAIDYHKLGYNNDKDDAGILSIPFLDKSATSVTTLHYKLLNGDGYRYPKGLGPNWFIPLPHDNAAEIAIIFEGEKKSIVACDKIGIIKYRGSVANVYATPMKLIPQAMLDELENYAHVIMLLDPDAYEKHNGSKETAVQRNARLIGKEKCMMVSRMPDKIDDMLLRGWVTPSAVQGAINRASKIT